ncbi:hypothetical protein [Phenylobacterium sp.]|jgi:hypothetical protein|uniref:hypothetical protein n=1 Tax=Phenylobacterium sp. TaxID=1871053 RepID=UPI002F946CD4
MDQVELSVRPAEGGWKIESSDGLEPLMFLSGGRAERSARALARVLSRAGKAVRLVIEDRGSRVVAQERFEPA